MVNLVVRRRAGLNRLDATGVVPDFAAGDGVLLNDFDNGLSANDGFGLLYGIHDLGKGLQEVLPAPGDSGGPTFLNGAVAGIHFAFRVSRSGLTSDVDGTLNQSFGVFGGDVRVSRFAGWIDAKTQVPEPSCWVVLSLAFILFLPKSSELLQPAVANASSRTSGKRRA